MESSQQPLLAKIEELERRCPGTHIYRKVLDELLVGPVLRFEVIVPMWSGGTQVVTINLASLNQTFEEWIDTEISRWPEPNDEDDAMYNVLCPVHGKVQLGKRYYDIQMSRPDERWVCPQCGAVSEFDDDSYEVWGC